MVQICLLGGVAALGDDGAALDVGPAKCQAVLAALALSPGAPVPVSRLVEMVWGSDPPRTAEKTLQSYVARLRKSLGADAIARVGAAYRLDVDPEAVDAARFERRLQEGDLPAALAEWAGDPLAGLEAEGLAPSADALAERHLAAIEAALGRAVDDDPVGAVGELTELTARHPFREGLWALLMTALYRCGRPADALAAYRRARGHMVGELGIEPGPRLRELEAMVLGHDERLGVAVAERPAAPPVPAPVDPAAFPAPRNGERGNLPRRVGRLVGRDEDLAAVAGALAVAPVVTLVGPAGIGKSALAVAAARAAEPDLAGGAWLVELAEVSDSGDVPRAAADALGVRESPGRGLAASVVSALASRHSLLVLDNCEHVVEGAAALARAVSEGCPDARVLATSREGLGVAGERLLAVDPLDPAGAAIDLFNERAAAAGAADADAWPDEVGEVCRILDGVPLAIELAAARARSLSPRELADRLRRDLRLLGGGRRPGPQHHRTLDAAIAWSHDMLPPAERVLFARLSVFAGLFDAAAAEQVGAGGDLDALDVADVLGGLVERSMVIAVPGPAGRRLRMLEPIRRFAAERLDEAGERAAARAAHARWCRGETERIRGLLAGHDEALGVAGLDALWPDLRAAVERACAAGDAALARGLVEPVATELLLRTRTEIGDWAERILPGAADGDVETVAFALSWAGQRHLLIQDREGWERLAARHGSPDHLLVRHARAFLHEDYPALLDLAPELASWLRARGDDHAAEFADLDAGAALLNLGRLDEHDAIVGSLVERWRMQGPPTFLNWGVMLLGYSARFAGDTARAERLFAEAVSVAVPPGTYSPNRPVEAGVVFRHGDPRGAARLLLSYVEELLDAGTAFGGDIAAVEFVAIADGSGRGAEAARILGWLATTNLLDAHGFRAMVADLEASVAADATLAAARSEGRELGDIGALELMRATLTALASGRDDEALEG